MSRITLLLGFERQTPNKKKMLMKINQQTENTISFMNEQTNKQFGDNLIFHYINLVGGVYTQYTLYTFEYRKRMNHMSFDTAVVAR